MGRAAQSFGDSMSAIEAKGSPDVDGLLRMGRLLRADPGYGAFLAEQVLGVRDRSGRLTALRANAAQRAFEQARGQGNIVLKARQMGMTTWVAGRFFLKTITARGVLSVQVAHTREAAEGIFAMVSRMWENLPAAWREGPLRRTRANTGQMVFGALDSEFRVMSAGEQNAGRGWTIQNLHASEVARWPGDAQETLAGLRAALAPGGEMTLESTPCGAYGAFHAEWMRAPETGLVRHFLPWWLEPAYRAAAATGEMTGAELELMREHGLDARQIGFRRGLERSFGGLRAQEFAEDAMSCFQASGECCFEVEEVEARMANLPPVQAKRRGGALLVWLPPLPGKEYVVAVDTAGGGSEGDYACVQVIELATGLQCAELREHLAPMELARQAATLAREYGGAQISVERNNHGAGVLAYLDALEHYPRLYEQGGVAGWLTTSASKPAMVSRMGALLAESPALFCSERLLAECRTFVRMENGRTGAASGAYDDCLMAMAVAQAVRAERLGRR